MFAIYGFCRIVDDIADDGIGTRAERHDALVKWRVDLDELYAGHPPERANFLVEPVAATACARTISSPSSTAWTWTWRKTSWRRI